MNRNHSELAARVSAALRAGSPAEAWRALEPHADAIGVDAELSSLWLTLLRITPERPGLRDEAARVIAAFPDRIELVLAACDALIRAAERKPLDEAPAPDGPAELAASAALACLEAASPDEPETRGYLLISLANALRLSRRFDEALPRYEEALALDASKGGWWFNLGLLHKTQRAWDAAADCFERARARLGAERGVLWNQALCATARGDGDAAVEALRALGHEARRSPAGMPHVDGLPPLQIRVATVGSGLDEPGDVPDRSVGFELLWVTPLSPCHGVVSSATHRVASVDYGDVVLWDGTPVGFGAHAGKPVPRFPLLAVLRRGDEHRFRFVALQQRAGQVAALERELPAGATMFIHQERIELLCARCASGEHLHKHRHLPPEEHRLVQGKIVLAAQGDLRAFRSELEAVLGRHPGVQLVIPELLEAIGDTRAAGKAHQIWRGLQRTARKAD